MNGFDFVSIGHIVKENIIFPDRKVGPLLGSPVAYSSLVASKLGVKTAIVTKIGADMPEELITPFKQANIVLLGIIGGEFSSTSTELIYNGAGNKKIGKCRSSVTSW